MNKLMIAVATAVVFATPVSAGNYTKGYVKRDGTYVAPSYRSNPNRTTLDNYSTKGNYNPYTGSAGTKNPYSSPNLKAYKAPKSKTYGF